MTIDPEAFMPLDQFSARVDRLVRHIKSSETVAGVTEVFVAGEIEFRTKAARLRDGIPLTAVVWRELEALAAEQQVPFELAFEPD
jgi:LDH2 family malate/lactate/ureidoglycolate dehydrogenase